MFERPGTVRLISELDIQPAPPHVAASIANAILVKSQPNNALVRDVLDQYAAGFKDAAATARLKERVHCARRSNGTERKLGLYHLACAAFPNNNELDGYLAEFYILWADEIGVQEDDVLEIFAGHGL